MYQFDDFLIDEKIVTSYFACDLKKCRGACCTFPGELGAPLLDDEIDEIKKCIDETKKFLPSRSLQVLENQGFYQGKPGKFTTVCINKRECVFVYYENNIAFCALERAYNEGKTQFKKPLSCHLFPIRIGNYGGKYMYYEKIEECDPAIDYGRSKHILLLDFLNEPLKRLLGDEKTNELIAFCNNCKNKY